MTVLMDVGVTVRVMFFACVLKGDLRTFRLRYLVLCTISLVSISLQVINNVGTL
jgi:hypothetical protein